MLVRGKIESIMKKILIFLFVFCSCSVNRFSQQNGCSRKYALEIADFAMKKARKGLSNYERTIKEEETYYMITYDLILDSTKIQVGGGSKITISKETCKILKQEFYQ